MSGLTGEVSGALGSVLRDLGLSRGGDSRGKLASFCSFTEGTQHRETPGKGSALVV